MTGTMPEEEKQTRKLSGFARIYRASPTPEGTVGTLRWLINMRARVVIALTAVLLLTSLIESIPRNVILNLSVVALAFLAFNSVYAFLLRGEPSTRRVELLKQVLAPFDAVLSTVVIYLAGGVLTPMFITYTLTILVSIILLDPKGVYRTGGIAVLLYCGLSVLEAYRLIPYVEGYWGPFSYYQAADLSIYGVRLIAICTMLMAITYIGNRIADIISHRNAQIETRIQDLRTLYDITNGLSNYMDEASMLRYLTTTLRTIQNARTCLVALMDTEGRVDVRASAGVPPEHLAKLRALDKNTPGIEALVKRAEPLIIEDVDKHPEYKPFVFDPSTKSIYAFPIKSDGKVVGAISLSFDKAKRISQEYNELLATIAAQAGAAMQRAQLFADTQRLAKQMSTLYEVGLYTGSTLSKDEVIKRTYDTITGLMEPDAYYMALYDPVTDTLSFDIFVENGEQMPRMRMSLDKGGLTARIVRDCKPVLVQDWLTEGEQYNAIAQKTGTDMLSYLGVPMISEDKVVGVISVQAARPMAFNDHDEKLLISVAGQAAMAMENARLHQLAQDQAKLDSLTKVYNHGHFLELTRKAVVDSDRDDTQVSLIMLDIDHFKQYNDTYGHVAGDNVLRMLANALKSSVRDTDFVGRWGGEEFCVLLQGVGITEAKRVSRLIRRAVAELYPVDGHGQLIPNPTVSQGISSYPHPSPTASDLIEQADAALYQAKRRGRNQLIVYEASGMKEATTTTGHLPAYPGMLKASTNTTPHLGQLKDGKTVTTGHLA